MKQNRMNRTKKGYRFGKKNKDMLYDKQGMDTEEHNLCEERLENWEMKHEKQGKR